MRGMILLTGATGFLGSQIARLLLNDTTNRLAVLVRGKDRAEAQRRLNRVWSAWPETTGSNDRVRVLRGDLSLPLLGMEASEYSELVHDLTHIIHAAAELKLDGDLEALRCSNVRATANLLELARQAHKDHGLKRFAHVSTAYVAGCRTGEVGEEDLLDDHGFNNVYEQTKFEGERLVRQAMTDFPVSVFRPGMVVGNSVTGEIQSFNTVYVPLRLYLSGKLKFIPARPEMPVNIIPVDYVAQTIVRLAFDERAVGLTFHVTAAKSRLPRTRELLEFARKYALQKLGNTPGHARFVPMPMHAAVMIAKRLAVPASLLSYFSENRSYRHDNIERLLGPYEPDWQAILPRLLDYAVSRGFLHRSKRTVHEQLVYRLQSRKLPIRIHDLSEGKISRPRSGTDICREIGITVKALRALGVTSGDRVAVVGLNSGRYLILDAAIGLAGAVSVPLYYTSPIKEIEEILTVSGARLLLIGTPAVLAGIKEMSFRTTIVSFCNSPVPDGLSSPVLSWEEFLTRGADTQFKAPSPMSGRFSYEAPIGLNDLATLRFTSGTTGSPKGVMFRHDQLLWLAETIASLVPWKARLAPMRYLSFLPMNHVVEGILGTYSPSYIPAPVDIYFLENFHSLSWALPRVRPTVFFSVPRFYLRVWERFSEGGAGRIYLRLSPHGLGKALRAALRPILKFLLLQRAGLDKCKQLIAGSAPCPGELLENFRELGIEIHNAYGLTEAPLVTLNRYGANRPGTVGMPLPRTEVRIADDGEILAAGPQVSAGYFGTPAEGIVKNGWLHTGDLGALTPEGGLIIRGRKKEVLITSYGKNILPIKIEEMLRQIPDMSEAMIIGDNRPYLCALLWLKSKPGTPTAFATIDESVRHINKQLSHPEQVKRWAILSESPAIGSGELTGNLKLRRQSVLSRRSEVVEMLYGMRGRGASGSPLPEFLGVLHIGECGQ
jgi:long-chain acyl-CoA synthetase